MTTDDLNVDTAHELLELGAATVGEASALARFCDEQISSVWRGGAMCGRAYTVRCHPGDNLAIHHAMERVQEWDVLVVDTDGHIGGYWGEVLAVAAQAKGVRGLITNGGVRDVDAMEQLRFPVFSAGIALPGTVKHEQGELQVRLCIAGAIVEPGDVVVADRDGVLFLPVSALPDALTSARQRMTNEERAMAELRAGRTTVDVFNLKQRV